MTRRSFLRAAGAAGAAFCSGCSALGAINAFVPSDTHRRTAGLRYGAHERQRLDVYEPLEMAHAAPVVVFFYGGNWNTGERAEYRFAGEALASQGFVAIVPDYRLYPEVRFPEFLRDCAAAVRWTADNVGARGGDARRIFLMGHSAGAYNAAMLALDAQYLEAAGVQRQAIEGWIGLAGPYDFLPLTGAVARGVFGFPDTPVTTQPIHFASADDPPALLATGSDDSRVNPGNSGRLATRLRASGATVTHIEYPGVSHARLLGALAPPLRGAPPVLSDVAAFVRRSSTATQRMS